MIPNNFIKWNIWNLTNKSSTLPFSLLTGAFKWSYHNLSVMLAEYIMKDSLKFLPGNTFHGRILWAQSTVLKIRVIHVIFPPQNEKELACIFYFHNHAYSKHLSAYNIGGVFSVLYTDYFICLSLSNTTLVIGCFLFIFGLLPRVIARRLWLFQEYSQTDSP